MTVVQADCVERRGCGERDGPADLPEEKQRAHHGGDICGSDLLLTASV
jgi:hypothetical protein